MSLVCRLPDGKIMLYIKVSTLRSLVVSCAHACMLVLTHACMRVCLSCAHSCMLVLTQANKLLFSDYALFFLQLHDLVVTCLKIQVTIIIIGALLTQIIRGR